MGERVQSKNGNQSHHMEINIFNKSGTIEAKRICHEAKTSGAKLRGAPLVKSERHGGKSGKDEGQTRPETGRECSGLVRAGTRSQSETAGAGCRS
jgi:hypothetical protein